MFNKFCSFFSSSQKEEATEPFTNQFDTLTKYGQGVRENGEFVGMCQAMTNAYLDLILNKKDPSEYLKDDKKFLQKAIHEENLEVDFREKNNGEEKHYTFYNNKIPHEDKEISFKELSPETIEENLNNKEHLLMTFELKNNQGHEIYLGKKDAYDCRFFDANFRGGESIKPCKELIPDVIDYLKSTYDFDSSKKINFGIG